MAAALLWATLFAASGPADTVDAGLLAGFTFEDLDGHWWKEQDFAGRFVLLDYWATWCVPCRGEVPVLREARRRFSKERLLILGVSLDRVDRRAVRAYLRELDVDWPQVHDGMGFGSPLAQRFHVEALPRSVLIDPAGRLVAVDLRGDVLLAALEGLLTSPEP